MSQKGPMLIGLEKHLQRIKVQEHIISQVWLSQCDVQSCIYK
jgi:hypothetical protein